MSISELTLLNFRNHNNLKINFKEQLVVIVGNNGVGKTNIIEAINFISTARSFRTTDSEKLIQNDFDYGSIEVKTNKTTLKAIISKEGKKFFCDRSSVKTLSDFIGIFKVVVFSPNDLFVINSSPKVRRRIFDSELSKIDKEYLILLNQYNLLIKDRNLLLKQNKLDQTLLEIIDQQLAPIICKISTKRFNYISEINIQLSKIYHLLTDKDLLIEVEYLSLTKELNQESIKKQLSENLQKDIITKQTNYGIHRDDFQFYCDKQLAKNYCSQGQIRLLMLSLKIVITKIIKDKFNQEPIILLDDVLSELDLSNQKRLFEMIKNSNQTIITCTHLDNVLKNLKYQKIEL